LSTSRVCLVMVGTKQTLGMAKLLTSFLNPPPRNGRSKEPLSPHLSLPPFVIHRLKMSEFTEAPADAGTGAGGSTSSPVLLRRLKGDYYGRMATASFVQSRSEPPRPLLLAAAVPGVPSIEVWDTRTGERVANLKGPDRVLAQAHTAYELPDHRPRIYAGGAKGKFMIFDGDSLEKAHEGDLGPGGVWACYVYRTLNEDGPRIVSGHGDGSVTVLDGEAGELVRRIEPPSAGAGSPVTALAGFDHPTLLEHRTVAAGKSLVWVICPEGSGEILMTLEVAEVPIRCLACFEPTHGPGRFCVAACTGRAAYVWEEGALMHRLQSEDDEENTMDMTVS
jgi:WD40 repeat protein